MIWPRLPILVGMDLWTSEAVFEFANRGVRIPVNGFAAPWKEGALLFKEVAAGLPAALLQAGICHLVVAVSGVTSRSRRRLQQLIGPGVERYHLAPATEDSMMSSSSKKPGWLVVELFAQFPRSPPSWDRRRSPIAAMNHTAQRIEKPKIDGESASARPCITTRSKRGLLASSGMFGTLAPMWAKLRPVAAGIDMSVPRLNAVTASRLTGAGRFAKTVACQTEMTPQASTSHIPHPPATMKCRNHMKLLQFCWLVRDRRMRLRGAEVALPIDLINVRRPKNSTQAQSSPSSVSSCR